MESGADVQAGPKARVWAAAAAFVALAALMALGVAMRRDFNHDEHQFIAAGALIARDGLLPYRDFAWFHVPTLALLYAALFRLTDPLLLAARLVNVAAAAATVALLLGVAAARLRQQAPWQRLLAGASTALLLMATPAFLHASGRAWNHDLPVLLALAAFLAQLAALERLGRASLLWSGGAGLLLGLAAGMRLSYAPLALPLLLAPLIWRVGVRRFVTLTLVWGAGALVGLLPALLLAAAAPDAFFFGNFSYAALNTRWYSMTEGAQAASLGRKLADTARFVLLQPGNALLLGVTIVALLRVYSWRQARDLWAWGLLWPFLIMGALAPTPAQMQYVYVFFPFLALGLLLALAQDPRPRAMTGALAIAALAATLLASPRIAEGLAIVASPGEWYPNKAHARGRFLAQLAESGPAGEVFTLAPALALEGGAAIDPQTATGPFAWRIAPLLAPVERARFQILGAEEFAAAMETRQPRALLTGLHGDDGGAESVQEEWAAAHGYVPVALPEEGTLWLSRTAEWGGQIALAADTFPTTLLHPGSAFVATLYLQATAPIRTNLNLLVRAADAAGNEIFRQEGWPYGSPTSTWAVGDVWPHGIEVKLPEDAAEGVYRVEASFYVPETLELVGGPAAVAWLVVGATGAESPQQPLARFGGSIELLEAAPPAAAGDGLLLPLRWRARVRPQADYTVFVHVLDGSGARVAQRDRPPLDGFYPTSAWLTGVAFGDEMTVALPAALDAPPYRVIVGLYDPASGARLPLESGGDAFTLTQFDALP